jgi:hypothetical protein
VKLYVLMSLNLLLVLFLFFELLCKNSRQDTQSELIGVLDGNFTVGLEMSFHRRELAGTDHTELSEVVAHNV